MLELIVKREVSERQKREKRGMRQGMKKAKSGGCIIEWAIVWHENNDDWFGRTVVEEVTWSNGYHDSSFGGRERDKLSAIFFSHWSKINSMGVVSLCFETECVWLLTGSLVCVRAQLCLTLCDPRDLAHQTALSMEFSSQEYWSGLPFPPPGNLPDPGFEPVSLMSSALAGVFFTTGATWEAPGLQRRQKREWIHRWDVK